MPCSRASDGILKQSRQVESIVPAAESNGKVIVLDGEGACPRENGKGLSTWEKEVKIYKEGSHHAVHQVLNRIYSSPNYMDLYERAKKGEDLPPFDPDYFDKAAAEAAVKDALSLPLSLRTGPRLYTKEMIPGAAMGMFGPARKEFKMRTEMDNGMVMTESTTGKRDGISARACANCGTPHNLFVYVKAFSAIWSYDDTPLQRRCVSGRVLLW